MPDQRRGLLLGVGAYALWGAFPLYWPLLEPSGAAEILAHRMVWSMLVMGLLVIVFGRIARVHAILADRRTTLLLVAAAVTITINWATFIYGVNSGRVVETSLGYFINPLVTVLLAVLILHERLRRVQWFAVGLGFVAVVVLAVDYGRPPWIALILAFSFGTYALAKKSANVGPVESLAVETALIAPFALAYLIVLASLGRSTFATEGLGHALLIPTTGVVTAIPLILFGAAAVRIPMVSLGLLQYLAPLIQFALGLLVFHEAMTTGRWVGFALVWAALALFTAEAVRHRSRQLRLTVAASAL